MRPINGKSVAFKLVVVSAASIAVCLATIFGVIIWQVRDRATETTLSEAATQAQAAARSFTTKIGQVIGASRSLKSTIEAGLTSKSMDRATVTSLLGPQIESFDLMFGAWMIEAPLGFDGKLGPAADFAHGTNASGVFAPYWTRSADGIIPVPVGEVNYDAEYYQKPATTLKAHATEPFIEPAAGHMLMMSVSDPVLVQGQLRGVVGFDIGLDSLAQTLKNERPFGTGRIYLLSSSGKWLTAPDDKQVMEQYRAEGADKIAEIVSKGEVATFEGVVGADGEEVYRVVYPFELPDLDSRWLLIEDVPVASVSAIVNKQTWFLIAGGIFIVAAVLMSLLLAVRVYVRKPIDLLLQQVDRLSHGEYGTPVVGQDRRDEVGALATSLEAFRHKLSNGRHLEEINERQRVTAEEEREHVEKERSASTEQQKKVVEALALGLTNLSSGNLAYRIAASFPGSYAELKENFNSAMTSLQATILRLGGAAATLNSGTSEISEGSEQLSRRTEQQAASLEQTAAALNEILGKVHESARTAGEAAEKVNRVCSDADQALDIVGKTIKAMRGIEEASSKVSQIIGVIDEIAFQTNLLALNAGVEAARAGDAGKGFAVVAQEVRELAQRSANAAREIKTLISASNDQIRQGVGLVDETGMALSRITGQVQSINDSIQTISTAAREQASSLNEINSAVNIMDQVTQQNAALVEETTAAANLLNDEANALRNIVSQFRIRDQMVTEAA